MQRVGARDQTEFLYQFAGWGNSLGADSRAARVQVAGLDLRHEPLQRTAEKVAAERTSQFEPYGGRITAQETPETSIGKRIEKVARVEVRFAITFARCSQDGVWTRFDSAVNEPGKVDAKEGEPRIGDRIN